MDASTRAELERLRRRAFGPDADIDADPDAVARLEELESQLREEHPVPVGAGGVDARTETARLASGSSSSATSDFRDPTSSVEQPTREDAETAAAPGSPAARNRRIRPFAIVAIGVVVALAAAGLVRVLLPQDDGQAVDTPMVTREAYTLARDPDAIVLLRIPLDGSFGDHIDLPAGDMPRFPTSGRVEWAEPLGEYYGWNLWIAGAAGALQREHCLVAERDGRTRGRCVVATLRSQSALVVTLPYARIAAAERPEGMDPGERVGFWWNLDEEITVLLAKDPPR